MNSSIKKVYVLGCLAAGALMFSLVNGVTIQTNDTAKHESTLKELYLGSGSIKSSKDGYLQFSKGLVGSGKNSIRTSDTVIVGGGKNTSSNGIIGGGSGNSANDGVVLGGEKNTSNSSGIVAGGSNNTSKSNGIVLGGNKNTAESNSLSMGVNSVAKGQSFAWNSNVSNMQGAIGATGGLLIGTNTNKTNANIVVNGLIRYENKYLGNGKPGEIKVSDGCFYFYDGKWHVVGGSTGVCNKSTARNCQWGVRELKDGDTVVGYTSANGACATTTVKCNNGNITPSGASPYCYPFTNGTCTPKSCNTSQYPLTSCPEHGICIQCTSVKSDCTAGDTKYRLDSCESGYAKSGNTCVKTTYSCTGKVPSSNVEKGSDTPTGGNKQWTEKKIGILGPCEFRCYSGFELMDGKCVESNDTPCSKITINGYSVPALNHTASTVVKATSGNLTCNATFKCDNGKVSMDGSESCSCPAGYTLSPSAGATLHNGSCVKGKEVDICVMHKDNSSGMGVNYSATTRSIYFELSQSLPFDVKVILPVTENNGRGDGSTISSYNLDEFIIGKGSISSQEHTYDSYNTCDYNREHDCGYSEYEFSDPYIDQPEVQYGNVTYKLSFCSEVGYKGPSCGTAHGTTRSDAPSTNAEKCSVGQPSAISGPNNYRWTWSCTKTGYQPVSCYASQGALCGFATVTTHSSKPTSNLCERGTASSVTIHDGDGVYFKQCGGDGITTYEWNCSLGDRYVRCVACGKDLSSLPTQQQLCGPLADYEMDSFPSDPSDSQLCNKGSPGLLLTQKPNNFKIFKHSWTCTYGTQTQTCFATSYCGYNEKGIYVCY